MITRIDTRKDDIEQWLKDANRSIATHEAAVKKKVAQILDAVDRKGDQMVLKYAKKYDHVKARSVADLRVPEQEPHAALERLTPEYRRSLTFAAQRIHKFHARQKNHMGENWEHLDDAGFILGCSKIPLQRVGLYIPGGSASYASTVLMCAIPARIAGVEELVMVTPAHEGVHDDTVLAAASLAHIDQIYSLGGAQAIAAMAYGTKTIPAVNKIVGPGNRYVSMAKSMVSDRVGIDTIAGPSEILIITDGHTNPDWVVLDAFAQAEHDVDARVTILSPDGAYLDTVLKRMDELLPTMERRDIIAQSLAEHGLIVRVKNIAEAIQISDHIAPEHLSLMVQNGESLLIDIHHAGAIFLGDMAAQVYGDYCAGPSHVLPTGGRARFDSVLNVSHFCRYSTVVGGAPRDSEAYQMTATLARAEGLEAHARAIEARITKPDTKEHVADSSAPANLEHPMHNEGNKQTGNDIVEHDTHAAG